MKRSMIACVLLLATLGGCSSDEPAGPDGAIDYQGTWTGNIGDPNAVQRTGVTWTATHIHNSVTGPLLFRLTPTLSATGTLSGNVVGTAIEFTLSVPAGSYPAPISLACRMTASGVTSTATATKIEALLAMSWTAPCLGTLTSVENANHRLSLTKLE